MKATKNRQNLSPASYRTSIQYCAMYTQQEEWPNVRKDEAIMLKNLPVYSIPQ